MPNLPIILNDTNSKKAMDFTPWGGFEGFLRDTSNGAGGWNTINILKRISPLLSKAVAMTATAVASLPFDILDDNDKVIDSSEDWQNKMGGLEQPKQLLYKLAASLCAGRAYIIPQYIGQMVTDLRYVATHTVLPLITTEGLQWFSRASDFGNAGIYSPILPFPATKNSSDYESIPVKHLDAKFLDAAADNYYGDIDRKKIDAILKEQNKADTFSGAMMYFWLPDPDIEIGPAKTYPLGTAMVSTQLAVGLDSAVKTLADRQFIRPSIFTFKGLSNVDERSRIEKWINGVIRNFGDTLQKVFNADTTQVTPIGDGMGEMRSYAEIKRQAIEEIGSAFGIPPAIFMSDKAFASEVDPMVKMWYENGIFVTIYRCIEETFNTQLLNQYGWTWRFDLQRLSAFQEDESKRAAAFREYASVRIRPSVAFQIVGGTMPEGIELTKLDEDFDKPETELPINPLNNPELPPGESKDPAANQNDAQNAGSVPKKAMVLSLDQEKERVLWYTKTKDWFGKGKMTNALNWECKFLPESISEPIREKLATVKNVLDIVKAFEISSDATPEPVYYSDNSGLKALADAINRAYEKQEPQPAPQPNISVTMPSITLTAQMPEAGQPSVTVTIPEQPAPVVNVTNQVNPTPVSVKNDVTVQPSDVVLPEPKNKKVTVTRDHTGKITSMETKDK